MIRRLVLSIMIMAIIMMITINDDGDDNNDNNDDDSNNKIDFIDVTLTCYFICFNASLIGSTIMKKSYPSSLQASGYTI